MIPRHVAVIMDGNGRWAQQRGLPRVRGHQIGVERVEEIMQAAQDAGVNYLTLYAFSKENWKRPKDEVTFLMKLLADYLDRKFEQMKKNNIVFNVIGEIADLPAEVAGKIKESMALSRNNTGLVTTFALSYSSRFEITRACRHLAEKVKKGELSSEEITEESISGELYTADLPDPDLLVRTSGEMRISNFLLWQLSYTEIYITPKFWPDFTKDEFLKAIEAYQQRERRFGGTTSVS